MSISAIISTVIGPVFDAVFKWKTQSNKIEISRQEFEILKQETEAGIKLKLMQ